MMRKAAVLAAFWLAAASALHSSSSFAEGIVFGSSRVIFHEDAESASIVVENGTTLTRLASAGVRLVDEETFLDGGRADDFICSPGVFVFEDGAKTSIRIIRTSDDMRSDRETLRLLRVRLIPERAENYAQTYTSPSLDAILTTYMKLIYRPLALDVAHAHTRAASKVRYKVDGSKLTLVNPTGYWLTVSHIATENGELNIKRGRSPMLSPLGGVLSLELNQLDESPGRVSIRIVEDNGGLSDEISIEPVTAK